MFWIKLTSQLKESYTQQSKNVFGWDFDSLKTIYRIIKSLGDTSMSITAYEPVGVTCSKWCQSSNELGKSELDVECPMPIWTISVRITNIQEDVRRNDRTWIVGRIRAGSFLLLSLSLWSLFDHKAPLTESSRVHDSIERIIIVRTRDRAPFRVNEGSSQTQNLWQKFVPSVCTRRENSMSHFRIGHSTVQLQSLVSIKLWILSCSLWSLRLSIPKDPDALSFAHVN